jgi:hypothetical protein
MLAIGAGGALLALPGVADAKSATLSGTVKGDTQSAPGRVGLVFELDKDGKPTKLASGSYNGIDAHCEQGGTIDTLGPIGSAKVKKDGTQLTFKWSGESGPGNTASVSGVIKKNARKATGTFSQSYNAGSTSQPFICSSEGVQFTIKRKKKRKHPKPASPVASFLAL